MTAGEPGAEWSAGRVGGGQVWTSATGSPSGSAASESSAAPSASSASASAAGSAGAATSAGPATPPPAAPRERRRDRERRQRNATRAEAKADVLEAREQLVAALNRLEDRVNVPKRTRLRAEEFARESPGATIAIGLVAAAAVGGIVWLLVRRAVRG